MKMAKLHLFAFSSFCTVCKVFPSPPSPCLLPLSTSAWFFFSQAHSSFCFSSFCFRFGQFLPSVLRSLHTTRFSTRMSPEATRWLATYLHMRSLCESPCVWVALCVCVCVWELSTRHRTVNLMVILNKAMKTGKRMRATVSSPSRSLSLSLSAFPRLFPPPFPHPSLTDGFIQIKWLVLSVFRRRRYLIENACNMRYLWDGGGEREGGGRAALQRQLVRCRRDTSAASWVPHPLCRRKSNVDKWRQRQRQR